MPRYFWDVACIEAIVLYWIIIIIIIIIVIIIVVIIIIIISSSRSRSSFRFPTKNDFLCFFFFFFWYGLTHFLLKDQCSYLGQVVIQLLLWWISKNKDVSSADHLAFEDNPSDNFLIYIKNNNWPRIEPWETPALASDQSGTCPFNKSLCFLFLSKVT